MESLKEIFKSIESNTLKLIDGLLEETAFLKVELEEMRNIMSETGMLKVHPTDKSKQKSMPVANEYRRTMNIYSLNIKVLATILNKLGDCEDDAFDFWVKSKLSEMEKRKQEFISS